MTILAIIPARGGSKRLPGKNIRPFMGIPVIAYPVRAALETKLFDEVMVSTDDTEIATIARAHGASVPFMRSRETSNDTATLTETIFEVLGRYADAGKKIDYCFGIYPVAPFLDSTILAEAVRQLVDSGADTIIPVIRYSHPIQRAIQLDDEGRACWVHPEFAMTRTQDLPVRFHDAGQFFGIKVDSFMKQGQIVMEHSLGLEMDESRAQDIDNEEDWKIAEVKYRIQQELK